MKNLQEACHLSNNLSVLFPIRLHTRHFTLSSQTSLGYFPYLPQTQREELTKLTQHSTRILIGACLAENLKLY